MEEVRKNNWFVSFLCILLALACFLAVLSINVDDTVDEQGKDEDSDDIINGDSNVEEPEESADYHVVSDIGYRTVGNVTAFFIVCENPEMDKDYPEEYYSTWEIWIDREYLKPTGDYVVDVRYSTDYGLTWVSMPDYMEIESAYGLHALTTKDPIYVSYTFISNCDSPKDELVNFSNEVLADRENMNEGLEDIYGEIFYYVNFPVIVQNTPIVPEHL